MIGDSVNVPLKKNEQPAPKIVLSNSHNSRQDYHFLCSKVLYNPYARRSLAPSLAARSSKLVGPHRAWPPHLSTRSRGELFNTTCNVQVRMIGPSSAVMIFPSLNTDANWPTGKKSTRLPWDVDRNFTGSHYDWPPHLSTRSQGELCSIPCNVPVRMVGPSSHTMIYVFPKQANAWWSSYSSC